MHESEYIDNTPIKHRRDFGQFFTPPIISRLMMQWILDCNPKSILDPAFGLGVFYDELAYFDPERKVDFTGYEIDKQIYSYIDVDKKINLKLNNVDYLKNDLGAFDGIICNPPYMRFQKIINRREILPIIERQTGKKLNGYSNVSSIFLVKALTELKINGNLAFIMPFEFFNTGYGKEIKRALVETHLLKQVIIFSNEKDIFPEATTTVSIILCKKNQREEPIKITRVKSKDDIVQISNISEYYHAKIASKDLPSNQKWTPIIKSFFSKTTIPQGFTKLSHYGAFSRGIATGANDFFALSEADINQWNLDGNVVKCITRSSQIKKSIFKENDFDTLYRLGKSVHCLDVVDHNSEAVMNYICEGERANYHQRYLTRKRKPWYKLEQRKTSPLLLGVFNRGRFKVVRNYTTAINFTCFHCFYPNSLGAEFIDQLFIYFISDMGQEIIKINKRSYGDNLDKFEPGDLNNCLFPNQYQLASIDEDAVKRVMKIAENDEVLAIELSNKLIDRLVNSNEKAKAKSIID